MKLVVVFGLLAFGCSGQQRRFPDNFLFGAATASYQIEGGWNADDKGENIWDYMTHNNPNVIKDRSNGDIACDTYHNYRRDVEMMRELGLDVYRMSLSWSRILPTGFSDYVSEAGVQFYNNFIDEMLQYGIQPMVTLYHWDLPQKLQELGGFANPLFSDWFEDYARVVFDRFGDRVKLWLTFNEPREICMDGYGGIKAPILNASGIGDYLCAKHLVMAHAKAYHAYNNDFKPNYGGECGITISVGWFAPLTDSPQDELAAEIMRQISWGIFTEPIFSEQGGFPTELAEGIAQRSKEQGYSRSRLPEFTEEERQFVRGASDFLGVNHYSGSFVFATEYTTDDSGAPSLSDITGIGTFVPDDWLQSASSWLILTPNSIYNALTDLMNKYNNPVMYITENGWSTTPGYLVDDDRITYFRAALESVLDSLDAGVNLKGYMAWSLMDNFEWMEGYTECFGLYQVDFDDPARTRTPRKSAYMYKQIIRDRVIDHSYEPDITQLTMTIDEGH